MGDDVETMLRTLLQNADYDIEKAQKGIIYIDEIDKIIGNEDVHNTIGFGAKVADKKEAEVDMAKVGNSMIL